MNNARSKIFDAENIDPCLRLRFLMLRTSVKIVLIVLARQD